MITTAIASMRRRARRRLRHGAAHGAPYGAPHGARRARTGYGRGAILGAGIVVLALVALAIALAPGAFALVPLESLQQARSQASSRPAPIPRESIPFGVGEQAQYRVSYNVVGRVGTGSMEIVGIDTVRGSPAFHAVFTLQGRFLFARVNNRFESWLDVDRVFSHRFEQNTHEVNFRRRRTREFLPDEMRWTGHTNDREEVGSLSTPEPLDDTSFLYYVRLMDLEVGEEHTLNRYWNEEGNPVRIHVLREEQVRVPAGTFNTLVLQPIIRTSGMFSEGGEAEVFFNRDWPHQLVMLKAKVSFGTLQLQLEEFTPASTPGG